MKGLCHIKSVYANPSISYHIILIKSYQGKQSWEYIYKDLSIINLLASLRLSCLVAEVRIFTIYVQNILPKLIPKLRQNIFCCAVHTVFSVIYQGKPFCNGILFFSLAGLNCGVLLIFMLSVKPSLCD